LDTQDPQRDTDPDAGTLPGPLGIRLLRVAGHLDSKKRTTAAVVQAMRFDS
jgi:hypothetical protein